MYAKFADKFWAKRSEKRQKRLKKKIGESVTRILYYVTEDPLYQKVAGKILTRSMVKLCHMKWAHHKMTKPEDGKHCGGEHAMMRGMGMKGKFWKKKGKFFKKKMMKEGVKFVLAYLKEVEESVRTLLGVVTSVADEKMKADPTACCIDHELVVKAVSECINETDGEKKPNEYYVDFFKRYFRGYSCCCNKKCIKRCRKFFHIALLLNGFKDTCAIEVASRWGAIMCCQTNGKKGCVETDCAEFAAKWIKDFCPIVLEAMKTYNETVEECKEEGDKKGEFRKQRIARRMILRYLKLNCVDGKFDKENFKGYVKERKEMRTTRWEKYGQKCCGGNGPCGMAQPPK